MAELEGIVIFWRRLLSRLVILSCTLHMACCSPLLQPPLPPGTLSSTPVRIRFLVNPQASRSVSSIRVSRVPHLGRCPAFVSPEYLVGYPVLLSPPSCFLAAIWLFKSLAKKTSSAELQTPPPKGVVVDCGHRDKGVGGELAIDDKTSSSASLSAEMPTLPIISQKLDSFNPGRLNNTKEGRPPQKSMLCFLVWI